MSDIPVVDACTKNPSLSKKTECPHSSKAVYPGLKYNSSIASKSSKAKTFILISASIVTPYVPLDFMLTPVIPGIGL